MGRFCEKENELVRSFSAVDSADLRMSYNNCFGSAFEEGKKNSGFLKYKDLKNLFLRYHANLSSECSNLLTLKIKWNKYKEHVKAFFKGFPIVSVLF